MISDLKLGLKLLRYGHGVKNTVVCSILIVLLGIIAAVTDLLSLNTGGLNFPIGYFLMLGAMFAIQLFYSVNAANLIQSSPLKKKLQTSVPAVLMTFIAMCGYLISVLAGAVGLMIAPEAAGHFCQQLLYTVLIMATILLYAAVAYKLFILSTIMFFVIFFSTFMYFTDNGWLRSLGGGTGMFWMIAAAGVGILLVCGFLYYLLSLAVYKRPLSKRAQAGALRREM
ncbi:MAG: hypothetical protein NC432_01435 [Roseburia sp.]|nr:hypothetical protein [Roseburia sp.]MCM1098113.1 hypothetical protein [Ruminococcus flavefaciens]